MITTFKNFIEKDNQTINEAYYLASAIEKIHKGIQKKAKYTFTVYSPYSNHYTDRATSTSFVISMLTGSGDYKYVSEDDVISILNSVKTTKLFNIKITEESYESEGEERPDFIIEFTAKRPKDIILNINMSEKLQILEPEVLRSLDTMIQTPKGIKTLSKVLKSLIK